MKKIILGFLSILFAGLTSFAQPVSDMAVIPVGITIQSVMRLTITKGGNMEFVFKNAADIGTGIPAAFGTAYETTGSITATQSWDLELLSDAATFAGDVAGTLPLTVIEHLVTSGAANSSFAGSGAIPATANATPVELIFCTSSAAASNRGANIAFSIQWACGATIATGTAIPTDAVASRYSANFILSLVATSHP